MASQARDTTTTSNPQASPLKRSSAKGKRRTRSYDSPGSSDSSDSYLSMDELVVGEPQAVDGGSSLKKPKLEETYIVDDETDAVHIDLSGDKYLPPIATTPSLPDSALFPDPFILSPTKAEDDVKNTILQSASQDHAVDPALESSGPSRGLDDLSWMFGGLRERPSAVSPPSPAPTKIGGNLDPSHFFGSNQAQPNFDPLADFVPIPRGRPLPAIPVEASSKPQHLYPSVNLPSQAIDIVADVLKSMQSASSRVATPPPRIPTPTQTVVSDEENVDSDRMFALQLLEEERSNAMNMEVVRYLSNNQTDDIITYDDLLARGLVSDETIEYLKNLDEIYNPTPAVQKNPVTPDNGSDVIIVDDFVPSPPKHFHSPPITIPDSEPEDEPEPAPQSDKGKGKAKQTDSSSDGNNSEVEVTGALFPSTTEPVTAFFATPSPMKPKPKLPVLSRCGICFDEFKPAQYPRIASDRGRSPKKQASSTTGAMIFGIVFDCAGMHGYCVTCISEWVRVKLLDGEKGGFPIRCPECSSEHKEGEAEWEISDETAEKILSGEEMEKWWAKKVMGSLSSDMFYCVNKLCSYPLEPPEDAEEVTIAECPACHQCMCFRCKTPWHADMTCDEQKELQQSSPEDKELYMMAKKEHWRRCPKCRMIVGKSEGCNHMTCRCRYEFCWLCGLTWGGTSTGSTCAGNCSGWRHDNSLVMGAGPSEPKSTSKSRSQSSSRRRRRPSNDRTDAAVPHPGDLGGVQLPVWRAF